VTLFLAAAAWFQKVVTGKNVEVIQEGQTNRDVNNPSEDTALEKIFSPGHCSPRSAAPKGKQRNFVLKAEDARNAAQAYI
jgi:hypothetical protein